MVCLKKNYQLELDRELEKIAASGEVPSLLLHSCCGPCSSYVLEYLAHYFEITVYYYNPNVYPPGEYEKRLSEQMRVISEMPFSRPVSLLPAEYAPEQFLRAVNGLEGEREGGARCAECFRLRLEDSARKAATFGFDYFTTTLSVSPHKNAELLNAIGSEMARKYGVTYLYSDFKKRDGYKRSVALSQRYGLYRQKYCGCQFSLQDKDGMEQK